MKIQYLNHVFQCRIFHVSPFWDHSYMESPSQIHPDFAKLPNWMEVSSSENHLLLWSIFHCQPCLMTPECKLRGLNYGTSPFFMGKLTKFLWSMAIFNGKTVLIMPWILMVPWSHSNWAPPKTFSERCWALAWVAQCNWQRAEGEAPGGMGCLWYVNTVMSYVILSCDS